MKLKINDDLDLELVYSFRSSMYFEQISGHALDLSKMTANDLVTLFYAVFVASLQKAKQTVMPMLEFLDVIDDNGGESCIVEFSNWYIDVMKKEFELLESTVQKTKEKKEKETKKKKS